MIPLSESFPWNCVSFPLTDWNFVFQWKGTLKTSVSFFCFVKKNVSNIVTLSKPTIFRESDKHHYTWVQMSRSWHETQEFNKNHQISNWATEASFCRRDTCDTALEPQRSVLFSFTHHKVCAHNRHIPGTQMAHAKLRNLDFYEIFEIFMNPFDVPCVCADTLCTLLPFKIA